MYTVHKMAYDEEIPYSNGGLYIHLEDKNKPLWVVLEDGKILVFENLMGRGRLTFCMYRTKKEAERKAAQYEDYKERTK